MLVKLLLRNSPEAIVTHKYKGYRLSFYSQFGIHRYIHKDSRTQYVLINIKRNMTAVPSSTSSSATSSSAETAKEIKTLLSQLNKSKKKRKKLHKQHTNNNTSDGGREVDVSREGREDAIRLDKLRKIFSELITRNEFTLSSSSSSATTNNISNNKGDNNEAKSQWNNWLVKQHALYTTHLLDDISSTTSSNNEGMTSLRTYCGVLASSPVPITGLSETTDNNKGSGSSGSDNKMVSERLLNKLLQSIFKSRTCLDSLSSLNSSSPPSSTSSSPSIPMEDSEQLLTTPEVILTQLHSELISQYYDVQYFTYKGISSIVLELIDGLERVRKLTKEDVDKDGGKDEKGDTDEEEEGSENVQDSNNEVLIANAERKVGLIAENICRLLLLMDYVPTKDTQSELEEDMSKYLVVPPALPSSWSVEISVKGEGYKEEDSEADSSSDDEESTDDEEDSTTNKRKKSSTSNSNKNKRIKKSKLIAWQQSYKHRNALQEAWLSVLRLPNIPLRIQKLVLQHLSNYILKVCPSPLRFAEYFTRVFQGGVESSSGSSSGSVSTSTNSLTSILSLHGLFILMLDHQLEYPQYYNSLYKLLHPRILYTKYRTRFLRLLCKSLLSNSMLPAYVVASFCKKLCRLGLNGPPSGSLFVLALVSNLLRKHGECGCLIHRKGKNEDDGLITDVFIENVDDDLIHTRALESSLWELTALEKHYHPAVSTLAKSVGMEDDKTTPMYDMEDFIVHTYKSLFEQEKKRLGGSGGSGGGKKRGGSKVSLTFVKPEGLFKDDDVFGDMFKSS